MSFSTITASPSWGTALTTQTIVFGDLSVLPKWTTTTEGLLMADMAVFSSAAVDTSGISKPLAGWVTYTGGGGGGSTRPTTGMIYPRGQ